MSITIHTAHPLDALCRAVDEIVYPAGVLKVPQRIAGTAFFPGGFGLWKDAPDEPLPPMPIGGVMILGHDFHSEVGYQASLKRNGEDLDANPTWRQLLELLKQADVQSENCFFTNFFPGLREGADSMGPFPGRRNQTFIADCRRIFQMQLAAQRPRVILTLGSHVPALLAELSDDLHPWRRTHSFTKIDSSPCGPVCHAVFNIDGSSPISATIIALTHPCMRLSNVHRRKYQNLTGHHAELRMLSFVTTCPEIQRSSKASLPRSVIASFES